MRKYFDAIDQIAGNVVSVRAGGVGYDELAVISTARGESLAQVIRLEDQQVSLQVFAGSQGVSNRDRIRFLHRPMQVPFFEGLLGRVFDGSGRARDGRGPVFGEMLEIGSPVVNPVKRRMPDKMVETGIPMIDVFNSLVESQKLPIFSVPGEPYNELLARIGLQASADIILLGGMGLRYDDYLEFRQTFDDGGVLGRTIMFIHTAADPVVECPPCPRPLLGNRRTVRASGQTRIDAPDRHDCLRRCSQGNLDHHGPDSLEPWVSRRSVYPVGQTVREGRRPGRTPVR